MIEINVKAIEERWETSYQTREGGWSKVRGQPDARADVRALLARIRELETIETIETIEAERRAHPLLALHAPATVHGREAFLRSMLRVGSSEEAREALELMTLPASPYSIESTAGPTSTGDEG